MALRLEIISRHRQSLGERGSMEFGHDGGTIGRSLESDWVLPDGQRYLSGRHASIDFHSGSYYIVDTSTNGVYVNDAEHPVGRGNPQRLFTGDRLRIGEYEMSVEVTDQEDPSETLTDDRHIDPVAKAQRVPPPDPMRGDLVSPHEITAVGIEMLISEDTNIVEVQRIAQANVDSLRLEEDYPAKPSHAAASATPAVQRAAERPQQPPAAEAPPARPRRPDPPPVSAAAHILQRPAPLPKSRPPAGAELSRAAAPPAAQPLLDAFFRGAGLPLQRLDERATEQVLRQLGQLMREVVTGVRENLHLRAQQKSVMRVPTTTVEPQNDNPLKFSASVEEALGNLLFRESSESLSAVDALRETLSDIRQHQQHLMAATRAAVVDYVSRLDPEELESKIGRAGGLLNAANKLKYWDLFKDLYQVVSSHQPGQFPQQFLEELSRAYELEESRAASAPASRSAKRG